MPEEVSPSSNPLSGVAPVRVSCRWRFSGSPLEEDARRYFHAADLLLSIVPASAQDECQHLPDATGTPLETLVRSIWGAIQDQDTTLEAAVEVILVPHDGYLCRSDILDMRVRHSEFVDAVIPFAAWDKYLPSLPVDNDPTLLTLLLSSPGALLVKRSHLCHDKTLKLLQDDLHMRLSFNWVLCRKPDARRVAVVGGRPFPDQKRGTYGSQGFFKAAQALGISMIVVDEPGHWLQGKTFAHLRDEFISMDMFDLAGLPQRLATALEGRQIDGIVTFTDEYVVATAEAAELLGLPGEPAKVMRQAHYKHEMRKLLGETNIQALTLDSAEQLDDPTMTEKLKGLQYPLVVKPCRAKMSESIKKVTNETSMRDAVHMMVEEGSAETGILLETYVDGPELDANFVLWDGEILFLEVTDNFPCAADASSATLADPFRETLQISNSRLPPEELELIRSSLHCSLLKLGFRSGVFHVEARMQNSSMRYQDAHGDGILDLVSSSNASGKNPGVFLVEVNVRPPGTGGTWATLFTYGVDQGALQFLRALDDRERFEALSNPFLFPSAGPGDGGGSQYWTAHCMVPIHRENIRVPEDLFEKVYSALPDIVPYVTRTEMYAQPETVVSPVKGTGWIAYVLLFSRRSRRHVLEMHHRLAETCVKVLDEGVVF